MSKSIKPWSNHRQVLWAIGAFDLLLLAFTLFMAWFLQGGFGPGKQTSPPGLPDLFGAVLLGIPFAYYLVVAHRASSRRLWIIGIIIHSILLTAFLFALVVSSGGVLIALPFLLVAPVTWFLYAKRNTFSETPG